MFSVKGNVKGNVIEKKRGSGTGEIRQRYCPEEVVSRGVFRLGAVFGRVLFSVECCFRTGARLFGREVTSKAGGDIIILWCYSIILL